jgi:hypothetical protein
VAVEVYLHNVDVVISKLVKVGQGFGPYVNNVLDDAVNEDIWPLWMRNISGMVSLRTLRAMGHPYSKKFPGASGDYKVNIQSGELMTATHIESGDDGSGHYVRLTNSSPQYIWLRYGTVKMRPRDPGGEAFTEAMPTIRARFAQAVQAGIIELFAS